MPQNLVLICDDVEDNRVVFKAVLEFGGFGVLAARDGAEGVESARAHTPSIILMDLMMPGTDGWQAIAQLRSDPITSGIPVVAVSADVSVSADALERAGFCAFVAKPILPRQLLDAVQRCLAQHAAGSWIKLPAYTPDAPLSVG